MAEMFLLINIVLKIEIFLYLKTDKTQKAG